jgi:hypothetical protein
MELLDAALKISASGKWQHFQKDFFYRLVSLTSGTSPVTNMKSPKRGPIRTIFAWLVGISIGLLLFGVGHELLTPILGEDSIAGIAIMFLTIMFASRIGMAIYAGQLNGGVSRNGNLLFLRWVAAISLLGCTGVLSELLLDMLLDVGWLKVLIEAVVLNGLGLLLFVKWNLSKLTSEDIYLHDAMVLHSALMAGNQGVTFGKLCRTSDTLYSPEMSGGERLPYKDDVTLGMICRADDPLYTYRSHDEMSRDYSIQSSLARVS